jgi:hypothetical protein
MKVLKIISITFIFSLINSCSNPELEAAQKKQEEIDCKVEFSKLLLENSLNIEVLAGKVGLQKEIDDFHKLQSDSTVSCDSIKNTWNRLSDLVLEKSETK